MKNVLMKNHVMNNNKADTTALTCLNEVLLNYDYRNSVSFFRTRERFNGNNLNLCYFKESIPSLQLIPFEYDGIFFNLIVCPTGEVEIEDIGIRKITKPFMLGETEVTQELFEYVMGFNYSKFKAPNRPVENVSWYDCLEFCNRLSDHFGLENCYVLDYKEFAGDAYGKSFHKPLSIKTADVTIKPYVAGFRLPKEWEWQLAALAGSNNKYAGTNNIDFLPRVAWIEQNSNSQTHPVAQKIPNDWGFYDMSGNVREWCENQSMGNSPYSSECYMPNVSDWCIQLGSDWGSSELSDLYISTRHQVGFDYSSVSGGFRIAMYV